MKQMLFLLLVCGLVSCSSSGNKPVPPTPKFFSTYQDLKPLADNPSLLVEKKVASPLKVYKSYRINSVHCYSSDNLMNNISAKPEVGFLLKGLPTAWASTLPPELEASKGSSVQTLLIDVAIMNLDPLYTGKDKAAFAPTLNNVSVEIRLTDQTTKQDVAKIINLRSSTDGFNAEAADKLFKQWASDLKYYIISN